MGNRYFIEVTCPNCSYHDDDVYYAPTCGFLHWHCPYCKGIVDLEKLTGIKDTSNDLLRNVIERMMELDEQEKGPLL